MTMQSLKYPQEEFERWGQVWYEIFRGLPNSCATIVIERSFKPA